LALLHGYYGQVRANSQVFHAQRWACNVRTTQVDVTNFVYYGSGAYASSLKEGELSFDVIFDTTENPFAGAVDLSPGTAATCELRLDTSGVTAAQWYFPNIIIMGVRHSHTVRDVSRFTVTARVSVTALAQVPTLPTV
jgi:hypothetical protein